MGLGKKRKSGGLQSQLGGGGQYEGGKRGKEKPVQEKCREGFRKEEKAAGLAQKSRTVTGATMKTKGQLVPGKEGRQKKKTGLISSNKKGFFLDRL